MKDFPKIGLGTWKMEGEDVFTSVKTAIESGYKHIDTAQVYNNEYQIGQALKKLKVEEKDLFITSKVWTKNFKKYTYDSVKESIKRLGVNKLDLMLLHSPLPLNRKDDLVKAYKDLIKAREEGLVDRIGVSNFTIELLEIIKKECGEYPFVNQIVFAPTVILENVEKFCKEKNIELTAYSTLRSYFNPNPWYEGSGMNEEQKSFVDKLVGKYNKNVGQILSQWSLQNGYHIIPKSVTPERIKTNIKLNDFSLTDEEIKKLRSWNTFTDSKMFDTFSTKLENLDQTYEEIQEEGLLFDKNF